MLALAGCGGSVERQAQAALPAAGSMRIPCATGAAAFAAGCTMERDASPAGLLLTVHRADGGFRRLLVVTDGRGVIAADGAEPARVRVVGADEIEVALGAERYRLPATVRARHGA